MAIALGSQDYSGDTRAQTSHADAPEGRWSDGLNEFATPSLLAALAVIFLFAGLVKGTVGLGLPTVSIALMTFVVPLPVAIALLLLPSAITNIWQAAVGGHFIALVRRLWLFLGLMGVMCWLVARTVASGGGTWPTLLLGIVVLVYAIMGLAKFRFNVSPAWEPFLSPIMGATTGVITGVTGISTMPGVPYMQALGLNRDALVQAFGMSFMTTTIALLVALTEVGTLDAPRAITSLFLLLPALAGMWLGQRLRPFLSERQFQVLLYLVLGAIAIHLIVTSI